MNIKIIKECSEFIKESQGSPLIKLLPAIGSDSRKIKVRAKKHSSKFNDLFNSVFSEHADLRSRCIFAHGKTYSSTLVETSDESLDLFYVLPINGYKYMYTPDVTNSYETYTESLNLLYEKVSTDQADAMFKDILKFSYVNSNLVEGIENGCEIILYGIPYYYAIRTSSVKSYSTLFSL